MKLKYLIGILAVISILVLAGCTSSSGKPAYSNESSTTASANNVQTTAETETQNQEVEAKEALPEVATLELFLAGMKNWDADADIDGIELQLQPKDSADKLVEAEGAVTAKAYERKFDYQKVDYIKGDLLQEWTAVSVSKDNYDFWSAKVRLEFNDSALQKILASDETCPLSLDVDFVYNGKTFSAKEDSVCDFS